MALGILPIGTEPLSHLPLEYNLSTPPKFQELLANPDAEIIYLVILRPHDGTAEHPVYFAEPRFATRPDDPNLPSQPFLGRLARRFEISSQLFAGRNPAGGGSSAGSEIEILNEAGEFDQWGAWAWDGRDVEIRAGLDDFTYIEFGPVAKWRAEALDMEDGLVSVRLADRAAVFAGDIQQNLYLGTGGAEGGADLTGAAKPLAFGIVRNAAPLPVDQAKLIYHLHDGKIDAVLAVRDKGVSLMFGADLANYGLLDAAATAPGTYDTCLAAGFIKLGSSPAGQVRVDLRGDAEGGYVETAAAIVRRIATTRLGAENLTDPDELNAVSFAAVDAASPAPIGLYLRGPRGAAAALTEIMGSLYGYWYFDREGRLAVGVFSRPTTTAATINDSLIDTKGLMQLPLATPPWRARVGYKRMWSVQRDDELAGSVSAADRDLYGNEFRFAVAENAVVLTKHKSAETLDWPTLLDNQADAAALANKIMSFSAPNLRRLRCTVMRSQLRYWLDDRVTIQTAQFGLGAGFKGVIAAISEDFRDGTAELEVVG